MNNLLKDLEALKITGNFDDSFWRSCIELVQKSFVPQKLVGNERPCEEKDFREYRLVVEKYLQNVRSTLQSIMQNCSERRMQIDRNAPPVKSFTFNLLALIGEHHEKNIWNTADSVLISRELNAAICSLHGYENSSEFLAANNNLVTLLLTLRPKLLKDTWKTYPSAVSCYKWIMCQAKKATLYEHMADVFPTTLIFIDDYVPDNVVIGLECLYQILQHCTMKKGLVDSGYADVVYHSLERLTHIREVKYIVPLYVCLANILATLEHWDKSMIPLEWTKRDNVLAVLLSNMEYEDNLELRHAYMSSLPQLITHIGCAKWGERLTRILSEYCEHHTDIRTLKATLKASKAFLVTLHFRVAAHCVPLYTAFLKLHFDLTETPVFDKEIIQNLEDCICLLYKSTPNIGCAIMRNDRIRFIIRNSLQVACTGDTRYFE